jgi:hypothetical protein
MLCGLGLAGQLGGVAGHEARVGGHVVPGAGPARGALLREADHAVRQEDAHGPGRHPQELGAQGHLHLAPQLRAVPLEKRSRRRSVGARHPEAHVLSAPDTAMWSRKGWWPTWQAARQEPCLFLLDGSADCFFCIQAAAWPDRIIAS